MLFDQRLDQPQEQKLNRNTTVLLTASSRKLSSTELVTSASTLHLILKVVFYDTAFRLVGWHTNFLVSVSSMGCNSTCMAECYCLDKVFRLYQLIVYSVHI